MTQARTLSLGALCAQTSPFGTRRTQLRSSSPSASCPSAPLSPPDPHRISNVDRQRCHRRCRRRRRREASLSTPAALSFLSRSRDPGDWDFSPEWYGSQGGGYGRDDGVVVYRSREVEVTAHPSSSGQDFEWRVLRFGNTRQSVSLVKKGGSSPEVVVLDPTCLAFEYTKTLVALSLALLPLPAKEDKEGEKKKKKKKRREVLCVGVGGGSVPAALAALRPDVEVSAYEVDERVVGSWPAMGLKLDTSPASSSSDSRDDPTPSGGGGGSSNLRLERRCGAEAVAAVAASSPGSLDLLIVDAFDAQDRVPALFTDPEKSAFFADAARALGPSGAALINLHCGPRPGPAAALAAMFSLGGGGEDDDDDEGGGGRRSRGGGGGPYSSSVAFDARRGQGKEAVSVTTKYAAALLDLPSSSASAFLVASRRQQNAIGVVARAGLLALRTTTEGGQEEKEGDSEEPAASSPTPVAAAVDAAALSAAASRGAAACAVALPFDVGSRANYGLLKL